MSSQCKIKHKTLTKIQKKEILKGLEKGDKSVNLTNECWLCYNTRTHNKDTHSIHIRYTHYSINTHKTTKNRKKIQLK